jgi:hypothetical protein
MDIMDLATPPQTEPPQLAECDCEPGCDCSACDCCTG